ncbi:MULTISPECIES: DNA (cytosine-5-)-methyltransferase [Planktothrix]|uniref:DNA (cytosine-5-)-methyltransferase n=1 Tax=Planktothrix TaxID=54304 RepID=UPI000422DD5C|nr:MULTISPECIES: DNA (cytosine-5-)-methyltransferase [Planktothrix]CAD5921553.1 Modification methylase NgoBI [Planktothrix agardhii]
MRYIDLFCGIGGFRIAINQVLTAKNIHPECVFSSDIDPDAQKIYQMNFGEQPAGDITQIEAEDIPEHDILLAGFPCQPFSICGQLKGFEDTRGTLFFDIARILANKKPNYFILENVKQLVGHNQGKTLKSIIEVLEKLGYTVEYKVLNALNCGLPQKRERIFIVGYRQSLPFQWEIQKIPMKPLSDILEPQVSDFYYASEKIRNNRLIKYQGKTHTEPTIWHENKAGHISAYPYSCALRAGASYNYLLVNGERRLTEREMLRLQGFSDEFKILGSYSTFRRLIGNSVAVSCVEIVMNCLLNTIENFAIDLK